MEPNTRISAAAFWSTFVDVMNEHSTDVYRLRYNNDPSQKLYRNTRPRSTHMVGGDESMVGKVIARLCQSEALPSQGERGFTRYIDAAYYSGEWVRGKKGAHLAVEVENEFAELSGTLRDLFQFQAQLKVGIFYADRPSEVEGQVRAALADVAASFQVDGFSESSTTEYLVVIAPEQCPETCGDPTAQCSAMMFKGSTPPLSIAVDRRSLWRAGEVCNFQLTTTPGPLFRMWHGIAANLGRGGLHNFTRSVKLSTPTEGRILKPVGPMGGVGAAKSGKSRAALDSTTGGRVEHPKTGIALCERPAFSGTNHGRGIANGSDIFQRALLQAPTITPSEPWRLSGT